MDRIQARQSSISERGSEAKRQDQARPVASRDPELCAICAQPGAREWRRGPDRLHGRREQYRLARCQGCSLVVEQSTPALRNAPALYVRISQDDLGEWPE